MMEEQPLLEKPQTWSITDKKCKWEFCVIEDQMVFDSTESHYTRSLYDLREIKIVPRFIPGMFKLGLKFDDGEYWYNTFNGPEIRDSIRQACNIYRPTYINQLKKDITSLQEALAVVSSHTNFGQIPPETRIYLRSRKLWPFC